MCLQEAVEAFGQLPAEHYSTGWVLCCVGRAHHEMVDYPAAARAFELARLIGPLGLVRTVPVLRRRACWLTSWHRGLWGPCWRWRLVPYQVPGIGAEQGMRRG